MNRKQKIIVSITGIFIVLLALVGLTYAYFLTRITGNENEKSISVTTANLKLVYNDGTDGVIGGQLILPSNKVYQKTFTVKNEGTANVNYGVYLIDVINDFVKKDDIKYTLSCTTDGTNDCNKLVDTNGELLKKTFPSIMTQLITNSIEPNETHTYTFKFTYLDTGKDQSIDMNKKLEAKIQIFGEEKNGEYFPYEEGTLAYSVINNARNVLNGTSLIIDGSVESKVANESSGVDEKVLASTLDDFGLSYYFRGAVLNNYVNYAEMCWRIVRIAGDGSIKLILEDQDQLCNSKDNSGNYNMDGDWNIPVSNANDASKTGNFGYKLDSSGVNYIEYLNTDNNAVYYNKSMATTFKNFQNNILKNYIEDLKSGEWCFADNAYKTEDADLVNTTPLTLNEKIALFKDFNIVVSGTPPYYYDSYIRLYGKNPKEPTLKCTGKIMDMYGDNETEMYVGALTADEIVYAGGLVSGNSNYYLLNNYQKTNNLAWFSLSPAHAFPFGDSVYVVNSGGSLGNQWLDTDQSFRPVISLKYGVDISQGEGTQEKPYVIK